MTFRVSEKEFVKKVAPLVCIKGKKLKEMTATQTYQVLRDIGFIIVDEKVLREMWKHHNKTFQYTAEEIFREVLDEEAQTMKFPCDSCEDKNICHIVCEKFEAYAKRYPTSRKVKAWVEEVG